jgi:hypothetical protein
VLTNILQEIAKFCDIDWDDNFGTMVFEYEEDTTSFFGYIYNRLSAILEEINIHTG